MPRKSQSNFLNVSQKKVALGLVGFLCEEIGGRNDPDSVLNPVKRN